MIGNSFHPLLVVQAILRESLSQLYMAKSIVSKVDGLYGKIILTSPVGSPLRSIELEMKLSIAMIIYHQTRLDVNGHTLLKFLTYVLLAQTTVLVHSKW